MKGLYAGLFLVGLLAAPLLNRAADRDDGSLGGDFTLRDHHGEPFALGDVRGKIVMLSFGYTYCPDVCPLTLTMTGQVLDSLEDQADEVVPLFISLDPERDTPELLAAYVRHFHPTIVGLTGDAPAIQQVAELFKARFAFHGDTQGDRYTLDHTAHLYLLDARGRVAEIIPFGLPAEHIRRRVLALLGDTGASRAAVEPNNPDARPSFTPQADLKRHSAGASR